MGILNGFDRVRIRGTLRWLCYVDGFGKYLSAMEVRLKDFKPYAEGITDRVRRATERMAEEAGRRRQYLGSRDSQNDWIKFRGAAQLRVSSTACRARPTNSSTTNRGGAV